VSVFDETAVGRVKHHVHRPLRSFRRAAFETDAVVFAGFERVIDAVARLERFDFDALFVRLRVGRGEFRQRNLFEIDGTEGVEPEVDPGFDHVVGNREGDDSRGPLSVDQRLETGQPGLFAPLFVFALEDHQHLGQRAVLGELGVAETVGRARLERLVEVDASEVRTGKTANPGHPVVESFNIVDIAPIVGPEVALPVGKRNRQQIFGGKQNR